MDFSPPSYRAASGDLTISISPLGLVELADEEFEVHGPRLNRYALNFAMYLGHHWSHRREMGEAQHTANYYRAFVDYLNRFTFGRGVHFGSPKETEAIVPEALRRVWNVDNNQEQILMEMGQIGGVTGDCFVKVAYEQPWEDSVGRVHPGRVRILPLNSSFVFPEWHPHDRTRLIRCKIKYRFWATSLEGTRQVMTYTEILTDDIVEEYLNDELIDSRPNPLGVIPVIHIPNMPVSGSPWGISDCQDIISINRQFNEISTDVADIINYHAAPVTVITGAKASQLEKGAKKVWAGLPKDASVFNLEGGGSGLQWALQYLETLKRTMHEMIGIPETALGQVQPISNTSGVALSIQFQPLMNRWTQKVAQYGAGLQRINELILMTLATNEPDALVWNPDEDMALEPDQVPVLDLQDPITFQTTVTFPPPLPLDKLVVLNEIQAKMSLGLESREGALRVLGEEFPDEKLAEIRDELIDDAKADGSLDLIKTMIANQIMEMTGVYPQENAPVPAQPPMPVDITGDGIPDMVSGPNMTQDPGALAAGQEIRNELLQRAYGTKLPQRRNPDNTQDG